MFDINKTDTDCPMYDEGLCVRTHASVCTCPPTTALRSSKAAVIARRMSFIM